MRAILSYIYYRLERTVVRASLHHNDDVITTTRSYNWYRYLEIILFKEKVKDRKSLNLRFKLHIFFNLASNGDLFNLFLGMCSFFWLYILPWISQADLLFYLFGLFL